MCVCVCVCVIYYCLTMKRGIKRTETNEGRQMYIPTYNEATLNARFGCFPSSVKYKSIGLFDIMTVELTTIMARVHIMLQCKRGFGVHEPKLHFAYW